LIANSIPYTQRAIVPGKTVEEVYETIKIWFRYNSCSVTKQNPPTDIEANYNADTHMFQIGPRNDFPKNINVRLSSFGEDVVLNITITQKIDRMGTRGYIYWGLRVKDLYEELGVNINESTLSELVPNTILNESINTRIKRIIFIMIAATFISWFLWENFQALGVMYIIVLIIPILLLAGWDLQGYRKLLTRLRKNLR
jgi:hypothetical protein